MSRSNSRSIYLARSGKIEGPFTSNDFDRLKKTGRLDEFRWLWESDSNEWVPLDPMPKTPPPPEGVQDRSLQHGLKGSLRAVFIPGRGSRSLLFSGKVKSFGALGCEVERPKGAFPMGLKKVDLQLIDEAGAFRSGPAQVVEIRNDVIVLEWSKGA